MSFFSEIAAGLGLSELKLSGGYSVINYNGEAVYLEGVVRLLSVDSECIKLRLRGANVALTGTELNIAELSGSVIIKGDVTSMEFERIGKRESKQADKGGNDESKK